MSWKGLLSCAEVKQISRGFHGNQNNSRLTRFGNALGNVSEKTIVDAEMKATFVKETGTSNFVKNPLQHPCTVMAAHLKGAAKKVLTRQVLQKTITALRHPSISLSLDIRHSVHCCGGVIRRRPGHQNGMLLSNGPGLLPGTPDPFYKFQHQAASPKDSQLCDNDGDDTECIGMQWRFGARKTTKTALAKKRLNDDVLLAKSLQQQFDQELEQQPVTEQPKCTLCLSDIPFDGSIVSIPSCDSCMLYCCVACFTSHLQIEATKASKECRPSSSIPCFNPRCKMSVCQADLRKYLSDHQLSTLDSNDLTRAIRDGNNEYIKCPSCCLLIEFDSSNQKSELANMKRRAVNNQVELDGQQVCLTKAYHYVKYRMRCAACNAVFCFSCNKIPYHLGQTCEEASNPLHCRFCDIPLTKSAQPTSWWRRKKKPYMQLEICSGGECVEKASETCLAKLPCGHPCNGIVGEKACPPCLHEDCAKGKEGLPSHDEFCSICWTEPLSGGPCIQLSCGHFVHHSCAVRKLEAGWPTSRITFTFMTCPLCSADIEHSSPKLQKLLTPLKKLKKDLQKRWMDRLRIEGLLTSARLTQKGERFYQRPMDFAQHVLCYYKCIKCAKPYFGGVQQCNVEEEANRPFRREELICGACVDKTTCDVHGTEYIQFKCRYCCKPAVWFCWGTTHFCDSCHRVLPRPIPQCKGADTCPSGIDHPPNGQEFALGCVACLAIKRGEPPITAP
eukprot:TRINITY_DN5073_c0_g1_i1.p1 TRINITY_DN5073_c0_g1~~TRINITY_DN5073_c0_g1_i1.p1  ORF type:complete len:801 (+),score=250.08 TRINITY_DN5073_c0_g1_i1:218-2404(+)